MLIARTVSSLLHVLHSAILSISSSIFTRLILVFPDILTIILIVLPSRYMKALLFFPTVTCCTALFFSCNKSYDLKECEMGALISLTLTVAEGIWLGILWRSVYFAARASAHHYIIASFHCCVRS